MLKQKKTLEEITLQLGVTEYDLRQFLHRNRLFNVNKEIRNLAFEIVKIKFRNPEYFRPTRDFFKAVCITQRRWWALYRGETKMTEDEYKRVSIHLGLTLEEAFDARQLNWIEELEDNKEI